MKTLQHFFKNYAEVSTKGDTKTIATFYSDHFLITSEDGSTCLPNDKKFQIWLRNKLNLNRQMGLEKMMVRKVNSRAIGNFLILAIVTWSAVYKNTDKNRTFKIHYILSTTDNNYTIVLYTNDENNESIMKKKELYKHFN